MKMKIGKIMIISGLVIASQTFFGEDLKEGQETNPRKKMKEKFQSREKNDAKLGANKDELSGDDTHGERMRNFINIFSPEEIQELQKIRRENPDKMREEIKKKLSEKNKVWEEENKKMRELSEKYRNASSETEKEEIKNSMGEKLKQQFSQKMEMNRKRLEHAEKKLDQLRKKFDDRQKKADSIIEEKIRELTRDPDLAW